MNVREGIIMRLHADQRRSNGNIAVWRLRKAFHNFILIIPDPLVARDVTFIRDN